MSHNKKHNYLIYKSNKTEFQSKADRKWISSYALWRWCSCDLDLPEFARCHMPQRGPAQPLWTPFCIIITTWGVGQFVLKSVLFRKTINFVGCLRRHDLRCKLKSFKT